MIVFIGTLVLYNVELIVFYCVGTICFGGVVV